jgi:hypothetical protein
MVEFVPMRRSLLVPVLALSLALAGPTRADERTTFKIMVHGRAVGTETVLAEDLGDSLRVSAHTLQMLGPHASDSLVKSMVILVDSWDLNLRDYRSVQRFHGHNTSRGLSMHDTTIVSYSELDGRGIGDTFARPPGRVFVIDPGLFSSFDLICRMLRGRAFEARPVNLLLLGYTDTLMVGRLVDRGDEVIPWGGRPVTARQFTLGEGGAQYVIWMSPSGRMLRFENTLSGVRVDRQAPAVRRAKPRPR